MTKDKANMSYGSANLTKVKSLQLSEYSKTILDYLISCVYLAIMIKIYVLKTLLQNWSVNKG